MRSLALLLALAGCCLDESSVGSTGSSGAAATSTGSAAATSSGSAAGSSSGGSSSGTAGTTGGSGTGGATSSGTTGGPPMCNGQPLSPPPPDAGPMISFSPNPVIDTDGGVLATSLSGQDIGGIYTFRVLGPDGGLLDTGMVPDCTVGGPCASVGMPTTSPVSWASDVGGFIRVEQFIFDLDGGQVCTTAGQDCGAHGPCCVGLSCQATDGGCSCGYAWPDASAL